MIEPWWASQDGRVVLYCGKCEDVLPTFEPGSIALTVTSPPYDQLRTYQGFEWDFEATARELFRVTCEGGLVVWNVGDSVVDGSETLTSFRQAIYFKDACGFRVHDTMIYEKAGFSIPSTDRYQQAFEYVFVLAKGKPTTFNPIVDKRNIRAGLPGSFGKCTKRQPDGSQSERARALTAEFGKRLNVWRGKTAGQENPCQSIEHPATMPYWLARDHIRSWSNEGDVILDPMAGSGTTLEAAIRCGRNAVGIEISREYADQIVERMKKLLAQPTLEMI